MPAKNEQLTEKSSIEDRMNVVINAYKEVTGETAVSADTEIFSFLTEVTPILRKSGVKKIDFPYFILLQNYNIKNAARYMKFL